MANRSVTVELKGRHGSYVAETEAAKKVTKGLSEQVEQVDQNLKKIPPDAAKAAAAMKLLGSSATDADHKIDMLGKRNVMKALEVKIASARAELGRLAAEFNRTGDGSLIGAIMKAQHELKQLERFSAQFASSMGQQGAKAGAQFSGGFMSSIMRFAPVIAPVLAVAIIEALAAAGGIILSTLPLAAIGTGLVAQHKNPQLASSASKAGSRLGGDIKYATEPLVGPASAAINELAITLSKAIRATRKDFEELAPYLQMLAAYLGEAATVFMPKFSKALKEAGPVLGVLAQDLPVLAAALGDFLIKISDNAEGGAKALDFLIRGVSYLIELIGDWISGAEMLFGGMLKGAEKVADVLDKITLFKPPWVDFDKFHKTLGYINMDWDSAITAATRFTKSTYDSSVALQQEQKELYKTVDALDQYFGKMMSLDRAAIAQKQSIQDLTESVKENGRSWDINTEKGRANRLAVLNSIQAAHDLYEANIKSGMSPAKAAALYNAQIAKIAEIAKKAGLAKTELDKLSGKYLVDLEIRTRYTQIGRPSDRLGSGERFFRYGGIQYAAQGAIVPESRGPLVKFVEHGTGGEGFVPRKGITHARAGALLGEMAGWHGYGLTDGNQWRGGGGGGGRAPINLSITLQDVDGNTTRRVMIRDAERRGIGSGAIQVAYP